MLRNRVPENISDTLYKLLEQENNRLRLIVCLYFLSDLDNRDSTLSVIETNLLKIFPPSVSEGKKPADYVDFQASEIRGFFNRETDYIKKGLMDENERYFVNVGRGCWKNTEKANREAEAFLKKHELLEYVAFSWRRLSKDVAFKTIDKSCLKHSISPIPQAFYDFFDYHTDDPKSRQVRLHYHDKTFDAKLYRKDRPGSPYLTIVWKRDFVDFIDRYIGITSEKIRHDDELDVRPEIRFQRIDSANYAVDILYNEVINRDSSSIDYDEDTYAEREGKRVMVHSYKYERNPKNRKKAIEYHGTRCYVCGFDFYEAYGELGEGFIEVHHKTPLYEQNGEFEINPKEDLVPVCSNCHRMLHRQRNEPLSIDALKNMLKGLKKD